MSGWYTIYCSECGAEIHVHEDWSHRPHYASTVGKTALLNGMKSIVKGVAQLCVSIVIGITHPVTANPVKRNVRLNGMRNPARTAALE